MNIFTVYEVIRLPTAPLLNPDVRMETSRMSELKQTLSHIQCLSGIMLGISHGKEN